MKQIIFFHPSSDLYGSDKILAYIIKCYYEYKITIILKSQGPLTDYLYSLFPNIEIIIIPSLPIIAKKNLNPIGIFLFFLSLIKFHNTIKTKISHKSSIIYLNTLAVTPVLFCLPNRKKFKVITHVHEILQNNKLLHRVINKIAIKYSNYIICVSNAVKNNLLNVATPLNKNKLLTIQNGISFNNSDKEQLSIDHQFDSSLINFALIGRIKPLNKGQNFLTESIALLPKHILDKAHFYYIGSTVVGQEYMLEEVQNKIKKLNLNNYIDILPFTPNIEEIYQNIDVSLVPSLCEDSFPTTILESMYWGKPVIGTIAGGIPEMIKNEVTGFLIKKNSTQEFANKIRFFIENPDQIKEMGDEGKKTFDENFTEKSFQARYIATLKKISIF